MNIVKNYDVTQVYVVIFSSLLNLNFSNFIFTCIFNLHITYFKLSVIWK